jgi:hypothetical protein
MMRNRSKCKEGQYLEKSSNEWKKWSCSLRGITELRLLLSVEGGFQKSAERNERLLHTILGVTSVRFGTVSLEVLLFLVIYFIGLLLIGNIE